MSRWVAVTRITLVIAAATGPMAADASAAAAACVDDRPDSTLARDTPEDVKRARGARPAATRLSLELHSPRTRRATHRYRAPRRPGVPAEQQAAIMWGRIAAAMELAAATAPLGEDRALAEEWSREIRRRLLLRVVR